jgi:hypothetical protein
VPYTAPFAVSLSQLWNTFWKYISCNSFMAHIDKALLESLEGHLLKHFGARLSSFGAPLGALSTPLRATFEQLLESLS